MIYTEKKYNNLFDNKLLANLLLEKKKKPKDSVDSFVPRIFFRQRLKSIFKIAR